MLVDERYFCGKASLKTLQIRVRKSARGERNLEGVRVPRLL